MGRKVFVCALISALLWAFPAWGAASPSNDDFLQAKKIQRLNTTLVANTTNATLESSEPTQCRPGANTVWYQLTLDETTGVRFDASQSDFKPVVSVFVGDALNELNVVACGSTDTTTLEVGFRRGVTYSIQVGGRDGSAGQLKMALTSHPTPSNDSVSNAIQGGASFYTQQETRFATLEEGERYNLGFCEEPGDPSFGEEHNIIGATVWYTISSESTDHFVLETADTDVDTLIAVYEGGMSGNLIACDNDSASLGTASRVEFKPKPGTTYHVQVGGLNGDRGLIRLSVRTEKGCVQTNGEAGDILIEVCSSQNQDGSPNASFIIDSGKGLPGLQCKFEGLGSGNCSGA